MCIRMPLGPGTLLWLWTATNNSDTRGHAILLSFRSSYVCTVYHFRDIITYLRKFRSHETLHTHHQGIIYLAMITLHTKFSPCPKIWRKIQNSKIVVIRGVLGHSRSSTMSLFDTAHAPHACAAYDCLLTFHTNYVNRVLILYNVR